MMRQVNIWMTLMAALVFFGAWQPAWAGPPLIFPEDRWHIALDPGHGGDDTGARGPTGLLEKNVSLELARSLALRLEDGFRVTLTRSDDYRVEIQQRAAIANQAKAKLYISLHAGASFQHATRGTIIYYHAPPRPDSGRSAKPGAPADKPLPWNQVQARHRPGSRALAQAFKAELANHLDIGQVTVMGAPLAQLEGADMPAVLIEVGHITHPAMEQRMTTTQGVESLAQALESAVEAYVQDFDSRQRQ